VSALSLGELLTQVREAARDFDGKWTLAATDLLTGDHVGVDEDDLMPTASVIKVPILISVYRAVSEGKVALEDRLRSGPENTVIGSGVLNKLNPGVEMSLYDAAVLMSIISDNVATNMCIDHVGGIQYVNETMRKLGLDSSEMFTRLGDPSRGLKGRDHYVMTAREAVRLWELIGRVKQFRRRRARI
jgi:beta-lactamase class A